MTGATPLPSPLDGLPPEAREYYERCAAGELCIQRCDDCGALRHHPRPHCTTCLSPRWTWVRCSGRGTVHAVTVVRQNQNPRFRDRLPYAVVVVELEEGPRMLSGTTGTATEAVRVGMPVRVVFEEDAGGLTVPRFEVVP